MKTNNIILSEWIIIFDFCATRAIKGTDPNLLENRIAFIEKSGRVRVKPFTKEEDFKNWEYVCSGSSDYGNDLETREKVDDKLIEIGYILE